MVPHQVLHKVPLLLQARHLAVVLVVLLQANLLTAHLVEVRPAAVLLISTVLLLQNALILDATTTLHLLVIQTVAQLIRINVWNVRSISMKMPCTA